MLHPDFFVDALKASGIEFFTGVPDSLLKDFCAYIHDNTAGEKNIVAANEGGAVALAAGYYLATGKIACVYLQNSGEGNAMNPLASLTDKDVYQIPVLLLIGWRGLPGMQDEPQHVKQGKVTTGFLNMMGIDYLILSKDEKAAERQIIKVTTRMREMKEPYAIVVEKDTFYPYEMAPSLDSPILLSREDAIRRVAAALYPTDVIVSTTGMISRELFAYREDAGEGHERDFLMVGSMGHSSQIALGVALEKKNYRVWCFDGDGAVIMHMGGMAIVAQHAPENYIHVVFNNGAHDSVGGQPTEGLNICLSEIALSLGYKEAFSVRDLNTLDSVLEDIRHKMGPLFIEILVKKGARKDLGRPTITPVQNKHAFMSFLKQK